METNVCFDNCTIYSILIPNFAKLKSIQADNIQYITIHLLFFLLLEQEKSFKRNSLQTNNWPTYLHDVRSWWPKPYHQQWFFSFLYAFLIKKKYIAEKNSFMLIFVRIQNQHQPYCTWVYFKIESIFLEIHVACD